ncbi:MAG: YIP1 family protein [Nitrospirota bacterium]|nr:YIP1 family protein [Nitrospirota bacterium]MDH5768091.1 YIP1 family protein [Nitrospirota bacterium]
MNIAERVKNILLKPKSEWQIIASETTTTGELYRSYIIPLAAIGPIASIIGMSLVGISMPFMGTYHVPLSMSIAHAVVSYTLTLISVYVVSLIINALAPTFSGEKDGIQALKVAAYSSTAAWLAGIFALIPVLSLLGLVGLYSLYLLYLGLPMLMKAPQEKALIYTVVVVISAIVIFFIVGAISNVFISYPSSTMHMPGMPGIR